MAGKDLTLNLKVESGSGEASIKKLAASLKKLETTDVGKSMSEGVAAATDQMKKMKENVAKAAEEYRKLIDASKNDAERLKTLNTNKKMWAAEETRLIADASRRDTERYNKLIRLEKERRDKVKRAQDQIVKIEKERYRKAIKLEKERAAQMNKAHGEAIAEEKKRAAQIEKTNRKIKKQNDLLKKQAGPIKTIKQHLFALRSYWLAISAAVSIATISVVKFFKSGFMAVEKFTLSVASMAASITTFSDLSGGNIAEVYANATLYAEELALKMELINVRTIATGEQLRAMNETFIQQGVLLDVNSKKQEDAFVAIANAISLITQGQNQEIQMRQEIRGLLSGDIRATNLLARMIDTKLNGELKKSILMWKRQGVLIEKLGEHLEGFKAGSADLASTWAALSTTFDTIINRHLRQAFRPIYSDIIKKSLEISRNMLSQKETSEGISDSLKMGMSKAWVTIKNVVQVILDTFWFMKQPLQVAWEIIKVMADGFGRFFATIAPITSRFRFLTKSVQSTVMAILRLGEAAWRVASFDFSGAAEQFKLAKSEWKEGGKMLGKAFGEGLSLEIALSLAEYDDPIFRKTPKGEKPELRDTGASEEGLKKAENWFKAWERLEKENQENIIRIKHDGYQQAVSLLMLEKQAMVDKYGEQLAITEHFKLKLDLLTKPETEREKEAEMEIAKLKAENHEKVLSYISTEIENKKRAVAQEVAMLANLTGNTEERAAILKAGQEKLDAIDVEANAEQLSKQNEHEEKMLEIRKTFDTEYAELGKTKFELEREQLARQEQMWEEAGVKRSEIDKRVSKQSLDIARAEQQSKLAIYSNMAGQIAGTFLQISQAGGEQSKEAFRAYQVFAVLEATMAAHLAIVKTLAEVSYPANIVMSAMIGAMAFAKVAMIASAQPPSYDQGGVSNAQGVYQTGNIAEAHIPIPSGGKIPVEVKEKEKEPAPQEINIVNVVDPSMIDEYFASAKGQDAVLNVIGKRGQMVKRILR